MTLLTTKGNMEIERVHLTLNSIKYRAALVADINHEAIISKAIETVSNNQVIEKLNLHGTAQHEEASGQFHVLR